MYCYNLGIYLLIRFNYLREVNSIFFEKLFKHQSVSKQLMIFSL